MSIEIRVPSLGESVTEATVGQWFKKPGDPVKVDEPLVELETDKVTVEVPAPSTGVLADIIIQQGETVEVGALLATLGQGTEASPAPAAKPSKSAAAPAPAESSSSSKEDMPPSPAARKALAEAGLSKTDVEGSGRRGQVLKHDVPAVSAQRAQPSSSATASYVPVAAPAPSQGLRVPSAPVDDQREQRVKMTRLRQTIARRLKDAQNTAAMLTTFNDVDMSAVMEMRSQYKDLFEKRHGVKLGFMGFFAKACIQALKEIPSINAEIDGQDLVYKDYYHIGVAVGTDRGLVVPVVREADKMSIAQIEGKIAEFGHKARNGQLGIEEMQGGTFTITNGGVFGSLMSTPILNAPQSGILGMHRVEQRPVVLKDGSIVARPMMYLALSYDHRIVDGKEAVTFLVRVKECLEDPHRFVLDL
ncbi:dihydrolipoyltranssuccinase [Candidatus Filomicrobium marinum]|uniref:Dihydrolipoyllysine-residue succinyltransferase component of 2-oxoglutarate dehydrogenase complex n=1 Tax=Candidatus Filomicrobium marinum TaxID=1608628 RepID=A0A0D6JD95_9HYPH|nr:2-oxoglutarate dehydrogenase complex dihydrolipoyllysine-residue succinyltransferase [Candidatus Filomicrobium marinum]CFX10649.1 dihydrolipoyltranssuccinase [Candidatus Filomicrobium marinum]CPR17154.1 dihydrolipoyltranssuccinase [Candidatus Filomicrobium marinum]